MPKYSLWRIGALAAGACGLSVGHPLAAQTPIQPWSLAATASLTGFRGAASNATDSGRVVIRPGQSVTAAITVTRHWRLWTLSLGASYLPTHVEGVSDEIAVQERARQLERVRFAAMLGRHLAHVGSGKLELRAGPVLDNWSADGQDRRTVTGGETAITLQFPAGPVVLENLLSFSWSGGPFHTDELPAGYQRQKLRAIGIGIGIRRGV